MGTKYSKLPKWKKKLTASQRRHLTESGGGTLAALKRNLQASVNIMNQSALSNPVPLCWDCWSIGKRLGLLVQTPMHVQPSEWKIL